MADNVTNGSLKPIYERLNGIPEYHPLESDTFADWSVEAGDIVTVTRDGNSYNSPVNQTSMTWKRGQQVQLSSTGKEERTSLTKMSQKKFNRSGGGMRRQDYWHQYVTDMYGNIKSGIELTESHASLYAQNLYKGMKSELLLTESTARLYTENLYSGMKSELELTESTARLYAQNLYKGMKSELELTESMARLYAQNLYKGMKSELEITESSVNLYTENLYNNMRSGLETSQSSAILYAQSKTSRAEIIAQINKKTGEAEALINADRILLNGKTKINDVLDVQDGFLQIKGNVYFSKGDLNLTSGKVIRLVEGASKIETLSGADVQGMIVKAQVDGDTLKLWKHGEDLSKDPAINFKKATTPVITWDSSQSVGRIKANAGGNIAYYNIAPRFYQFPGDQQHPNGQYVIECSHVEGQSTLSLSKSSKEYKLGLNSTSTGVQIQNASGTKISFTPELSLGAYLETKTISKSGTYEPSDGKIGFSKVTVEKPTLGWSTSNKYVYVVGDSTANYNVSTAFYHPSSAYYIGLFHTDERGNTNWLGSSGHRVALKRTGTTVKIVDPSDDDKQYNQSPEYTIPLSTKTIYSNGTYTPDSGVGFSSVEVQVEAPEPSYNATFSSAGTFQSSQDPSSVLAGWSPVYCDGIPSSAPNTYRYIKFKVDGKQRSFYFA